MSDKYLGAKATQVYDQDYFSGTQASIYIGDVWVDEITSFSYQVTQNKTPIYGYASQLFDAMSRGPRLVRGSFTINFKEAGYLFLVLERHRRLRGGSTPFSKTGQLSRLNIEQLYGLNKDDKFFDESNADMTKIERYKIFQDLAGFASQEAKSGVGISRAEDAFEAFEDRVWKNKQSDLDTMKRSADDHRINGFDVFLQFGDWTNSLANHTVIKLDNVHIIESSIIVSANGQPIQESYSFLGRNKV